MYRHFLIFLKGEPVLQTKKIFNDMMKCKDFKITNPDKNTLKFEDINTGEIKFATVLPFNYLDKLNDYYNWKGEDLEMWWNSNGMDLDREKFDLFLEYFEGDKKQIEDLMKRKEKIQ